MSLTGRLHRQAFLLDIGGFAFLETMLLKDFRFSVGQGFPVDGAGAAMKGTANYIYEFCP